MSGTSSSAHSACSVTAWISTWTVDLQQFCMDDLSQSLCAQQDVPLHSAAAWIQADQLSMIPMAEACNACTDT